MWFRCSVLSYAFKSQSHFIMEFYLIASFDKQWLVWHYCFFIHRSLTIFFFKITIKWDLSVVWMLKTSFGCQSNVYYDSVFSSIDYLTTSVAHLHCRRMFLLFSQYLNRISSLRQAHPQVEINDAFICVVDFCINCSVWSVFYHAQIC